MAGRSCLLSKASTLLASTQLSWKSIQKNVAMLLISFLLNLLVKPLSLPFPTTKFRNIKNGLGKKKISQAIKKIEIAKNCNNMAVHTMYFSCGAVWIVGCMWIRRGCRCSNHVFVQSRRFLLLYSLPGHISKCPVALKKFLSALAESINGKSTKAVILQNKDGNPKNTGEWWICISSWLWVAED